MQIYIVGNENGKLVVLSSLHKKIEAVDMERIGEVHFLRLGIYEKRNFLDSIICGPREFYTR